MERNGPTISVQEGGTLQLTLEAIAAFGATQTELQLLPAAKIDTIDAQADIDGKTTARFKVFLHKKGLCSFCLSVSLFVYLSVCIYSGLHSKRSPRFSCLSKWKHTTCYLLSHCHPDRQYSGRRRTAHCTCQGPAKYIRNHRNKWAGFC